MGGERASTTRMRLSGKICCFCSSLMPMPYSGRETPCSKCSDARKSKHRVYMHFLLRDGWYCQFLETDLKTSLPRKLTLKTPDDIRAMVERVGAPMNTEERQGFEYGIENGRGSAWLSLTREQYEKLKCPARISKAPRAPRSPDGS
jgi:hypothetical protein